MVGRKQTFADYNALLAEELAQERGGIRDELKLLARPSDVGAL